MLVCGLNFALSRRWTLYEEQVPSPVDSPAHQGEFVVDVLERLRVGPGADPDARAWRSIPEATPFDEVLRRVANSSETLFPVVDADGPADRDLHPPRRPARPARLRLGPAGAGRRPRDPAGRDRHPDDDLHTALRRLTELNLDEIPVVAPDDPTRLIGLLDRRELVAAYSRQIDALRSPEQASGHVSEPSDATAKQPAEPG